MKRLLPLFAFVAATFFAGCANEGPTAQEVGDQFQRGVRGEGELTPGPDRSNDPYVKPREGRPGPAGGR